MKKYLIPIIVMIIVLIISGCSGDIKSPLDNPDIDWVSEKIKEVEGIQLVEIDPNEDNPDLRLGGYGPRTGRLYFSYNDLSNDSPLVAGTDGGGSIEVYSSVEDANMRNEYLTDFLNGSAGGSTVIGTIVIRTSSSLSEDEQSVLEQLIIESLNNEKEN